MNENVDKYSELQYIMKELLKPDFNGEIKIGNIIHFNKFKLSKKFKNMYSYVTNTHNHKHSIKDMDEFCKFVFFLKDAINADKKLKDLSLKKRSIKVLSMWRNKT
jgi:alcohol dehydrogenase class IV